MITSLSELCFRFSRFITLEQTKKSDFYEPWQQHKLLKTTEMRFDLILTMRDIYINSNLNPLKCSLAAAEALSLKIPSHGTSLKSSQRPSQSARKLS